VAASVLRHVPAEAVYVGILPAGVSDAQRPQAVRDLLDARSEAQGVHGLEMRTELRFGAPADELARRLAEAPEQQMLILGISDIKDLQARYAPVLRGEARHPFIVVYRPTESARVETALASNE
jgi:sulfate/thiosulfate transport system ATP-binding protein